MKPKPYRTIKPAYKPSSKIDPEKLKEVLRELREKREANPVVPDASIYETAPYLYFGPSDPARKTSAG